MRTERQEHGDEVCKLHKQLYVCAYGATPPAPLIAPSDDEDENTVPGSGGHCGGNGWGPTGPKQVPFRPALDLREEIRGLKAERIQWHAIPDAVKHMRKTLLTAQTNEALARSRQALAEFKSLEAIAAQDKALASARLEEKKAMAKISEHAAATEHLRLAAEVAIAKAGRREVEASAAIKKAAKHVKELETKKESISKELLLTVQIAQAEIAHAEDAQACADFQRESLSHALSAAEKDRCDAHIAAAQTKAKLKEMDQDCKDAKGKVERLQSQLGRAHVEVARATESAQKQAMQVLTLKDKLKAHVAQAEVEKRHVLQLKAKMAQRARDATKRAFIGG